MSHRGRDFCAEPGKASVCGHQSIRLQMSFTSDFRPWVFKGMTSLCSSLCSFLRVQGIGEHLNHDSHPKGRDGTPTLTPWAYPRETYKCKTLQTGQQWRSQLSGALPFMAAPRELVLGPQGRCLPGMSKCSSGGAWTASGWALASLRASGPGQLEGSPGDFQGPGFF